MSSEYMSSNISQRAQESLALECPLFAAFMEVMDKLQHPEFNPNGALNLGLAHNDLLTEMVFEKVL
jgi:1-aminocyclopropane-1-carboxylate synthase